MSKRDVKPLVFRSLDGEPVVPAWLRHAHRTSVHPATGALAFDKPSSVPPPPPVPSPPSTEESELEPESERELESAAETDDDAQDQEPEPFPSAAARSPSLAASIGQNKYRRSSLPPRHSAAPPPVVISRPPSVPPPPEVQPTLPPPPAQPKLTPAEQEQFAEAALELASLRARVLSTMEPQLLELAVKVAEVIIEREVEGDPALYQKFARAALSALGDTRLAKLRVSRQAYRAISEIHGEEAVEVDGVRVEMTIDNSLEGLSVVAESGASRVDGRVSERLGAVLRSMTADMRRHGMEDES